MKFLLGALIGFLVGALAGILTVISLAFQWLEPLIEWLTESQARPPSTTTEEAQP